MLPTPSKFHYIFNLRDLSRIWQGMVNIRAEECNGVTTLLALFKSECTRVIADRYISYIHCKSPGKCFRNKLQLYEMLLCCRFICSEDRDWFDKAISSVIKEHVDPTIVPELHPEPYFVDFLRDAPEPTGEEEDDACFDAPKIYELV